LLHAIFKHAMAMKWMLAKCYCGSRRIQ